MYASFFHGGNTGSNPVGDANFRAYLIADTDGIPIGFFPLPLCLAKILSGSEINSLHTFLSRGFCYDWCACSATWD